MWAVPAVALLTGALTPAASGHVHAAHDQAPSAPVGHHASYASYAAQYGRGTAPGSPEFEERKALYAKRAAFVAEQNGRPERRWNAGLNHLSDRTDEELAQLRGWRGAASRSRGGKAGSAQVAPQALLATGRSVSLPQVFNNWTKLASLSSVRDQGGCGSCWAVAASVVLEAHAEIYDKASKKGRAQKFSTQELLDCVPNPHHCGGSGGCDGATVELAFDWAINNGLAKDSENPYKARNGKCRKSGGKGSSAALQLSDSVEDLTRVGVHFAKSQGSSFLGSKKSHGPGLTAWERLPENEAEPLVRALVERGPVGVSVSADSWFMYSSGVFDSCPADAVIDHAVTLVGLGVQKGQKYWLIQNSWGAGWGEKGRIKLLRRDDDNERCGTDSQPEVGTACDGGPAKVRVCGMCGVLYDSAVPHFVH